MAGITGNKPLITLPVKRFLFVLLLVVVLSCVSGCEARGPRGNRKLEDEAGTNKANAASVVDSRSVGKDMPRESPPCDSSPCKNNAKCAAEGESSYVCHCLAGHFGRRCEDADPCWSSPCQHQGKCVPLDRDYSCKCQPQSTGNNCEHTTPTPCTAAYCLNGGVCKVLTDGHVNCVCTQGYFGHRCQLVSDAAFENKTNTTTTVSPLNLRRHGRSTYDVLMLDVAIIGVMSFVFSVFMCACVVFMGKPRSRQPARLDGNEKASLLVQCQ